MSKNTEKKLCEYIHVLEELINLMLDNNEKKNKEVNQRIDKLKTLLAKRGITPEEIETVLSFNEPYDNSLEQLKNDLINETLPMDMSGTEIFHQVGIKGRINQFINQNHLELENIGINLNDNHKK